MSYVYTADNLWGTLLKENHIFHKIPLFVDNISNKQARGKALKKITYTLLKIINTKIKKKIKKIN